MNENYIIVLYNNSLYNKKYCLCNLKYMTIYFWTTNKCHICFNNPKNMYVYIFKSCNENLN